MKKGINSYVLSLFTVLFGMFLLCAPALAEEEKPEGAEACNLSYMATEYLGPDVQIDQKTYKVDISNLSAIEPQCWYCKVVIAMTNAYLKAAEQALPISQQFGQLIVKLGFGIWLALYLLKQLGATNSTTPGKLLSQILVMGFKCAFATLAITEGISFFVTYVIDPIMLTGTDMGVALLQAIGPA